MVSFFPMDRKMKPVIPSTVCELLELRLQLSPTATACISHSQNGECPKLTWQDFTAQVLRFSLGFQSLVTKPGEVAAILLTSSVTYELVSHALMRLGGVVVGLDCQATPQDMISVLHRCAATLLVTDATFFEQFGDSVTSSVKSVVLVDAVRSPTSSKLPNSVFYLRELSHASKTVSSIEKSVPRPNDIATIIFTSGTTGEPKGIPFRHEQIMAACGALCAAYPELGEEDSTICWLPLSALFQRMVNLVSMACGMTTHFIEDPRQILKSIGEIQPTFLVGVPRLFEKLRDALRDTRNTELRTCARRTKYMISGSAPLPSSLLAELRTFGILVLEAYGQSENAIPIAVNRATDYRFGSVGKPLPPNQTRLADDGEVEVRGIGLFSHYLGQERASNLTSDDYYQTGDLGVFDQDGFLYLTGRKRDLIKTSTGRRIGPSRIEAAYSCCRSIDQIVVIGDGQKYLAALVTLKSSARPVGGDAPNLTDEELLAEVRSVDECLSEHERVQAFGILGRPFQADEVTSSQKLKRNVIVRNYAAFIARLYEAETPCVLQARADELLKTTEGRLGLE